MKHKVRHIHFVGIGGAGMSGIAEVLATLAYKVSGSRAASATANAAASAAANAASASAAAPAAASDGTTESSEPSSDGPMPDTSTFRLRK